jgi:hypothetical protein
MKKTYQKEIEMIVTEVGLLALLGAFALLALPVFAATLSSAPLSVDVKQGQTFNVNISADPQGSKAYTVKLELKFPANLLEVKSFNFGDNYSWVAVSQPGYDLLDNTNGVLVKTAGYPKGFSSPVTFGTATFVAKKDGNGTIEVGADSMVLDSTSKNILSGAQGKTSVSIATLTASLPTPATTSTPKPTVLGQRTAQIPTSTPTTILSSPSVSPEVGTKTQPEAGPKAGLFAAIGSVITLGSGKVWLGILVVLILIVVVYYLVKAIFRRSKGKMPA